MTFHERLVHALATFGFGLGGFIVLRHLLVGVVGGWCQVDSPCPRRYVDRQVGREGDREAATDRVTGR